MEEEETVTGGRKRGFHTHWGFYARDGCCGIGGDDDDDDDAVDAHHVSSFHLLPIFW